MVVKRDRERERHPTRSNKQSRNSVFPSLCFLESSKPKHTYIRASTGTQNESRSFLSSTHPPLSGSPATCLVLILLSLMFIKRNISSSCDIAFCVLQRRVSMLTWVKLFFFFVFLRGCVCFCSHLHCHLGSHPHRRLKRWPHCHTEMHLAHASVWLPVGEKTQNK